MDRIIFCVFLEKDLKIYSRKLCSFFPPEEEKEEEEEEEEKGEPREGEEVGKEDTGAGATGDTG